MKSTRNKSSYYLWLLAIASVTIVGSAWIGLLLSEKPESRSMSKEYTADIRSKNGYQIKDIVQNFSLRNIDNQIISLNDYSDQNGVVVIFTSNHCPFVKAYKDRIIALHNKYQEKGFSLIAINSTYEETISENKAEQSYGFPYLSDSTQVVAKQFGAVKTPHVYLLKRNDQTFTVEYIGSIDDNPQDSSAISQRYVEDAIESLLRNEPIEITTTKAIGCAIEWRVI